MRELSVLGNVVYADKYSRGKQTEGYLRKQGVYGSALSGCG